MPLSPRIAALRRYRLLDTPGNERLDRIARFAADVLGTRMAIVSFVDETRVWLKSRINVQLNEVAVETAFCAHAVTTPNEVFVVADAARDERFSGNALTLPPHNARFYAGAPLVDADGHALGALAVLDRQPRTLKRKELEWLKTLSTFVVQEIERAIGRETLRIFQAFAAHAGDALLFMEHPNGDADPLIIYANPAFERLMGYTVDELRGKSPLEMFVGPETSADALAAIRGAIKMLSPLTLESIDYRKNGTAFLADMTLSPIFDDNGQCTHWLAARRDVTQQRRAVRELEEQRARSEFSEHMSREIAERERAQEALSFMAFHDSVTGLPNRALFVRDVSNDLHHGRSGAVLAIGIKSLASISSTLGHQCAEHVLGEAAQRLRSALPPNALLARLEGGVLSVWIPGISDPSDAVQVSSSSVIAEFAKPFLVSEESLLVHASVGIAVGLARDGKRVDDLLRDAETAMFEAKRSSGSRSYVFSSGLQDAALARLRTEFQLQQAIENDEFIVHYQPILHASSGRPGAFEALVRWNAPEQGLLLPGDFISVAEQSGQIREIGLRVLEAACRDARFFCTHNSAADLTLNVNVSVRQLADGDFASNVLAVLKRAGLEPARLCLEITESVLADDERTSMRNLETLRHAGIRIALDDFGTGYSSLGYLRRFPLDAIKIDRSFISARTSSSDELADPAIVEMVVALANTLKLSVTAEGVETASQFRKARALGCTHAQGYFIARPMAAADAHEWLRNKQLG